MERVLRVRNAVWAGMCAMLRPEETSQQKIQKILEKSDAQALQDDWTVVGNDIRNAMDTYAKYYGK